MLLADLLHSAMGAFVSETRVDLHNAAMRDLMCAADDLGIAHDVAAQIEPSDNYSPEFQTWLNTTLQTHD
jgi:hypothetical protein